MERVEGSSRGLIRSTIQEFSGSDGEMQETHRSRRQSG